MALPVTLLEQQGRLDEQQLEDELCNRPTRQTLKLSADQYAAICSEVRRRWAAGYPRRRCSLQAIALEGLRLALPLTFDEIARSQS